LFDDREERSMSGTKAKARTIEGVEKELEEVRAGAADMRAERATLSEPPKIGWDGVTPETLSRVAEADTKRAALPHAITDGEVRILELELELVRARRPGAQREVERRYMALQKAEERLREAQEERNAGALQEVPPINS